MPNIGRARPELRTSLRTVAFGNYVIFYPVEQDVVWIQRIIRGAHDIDAIFENDA